MSEQNQQFRLAARPQGTPKASDWQLTEAPVPTPGDGEVLVRNRYISLDPAMRGWMNEGRSYIRPVAIDEVMRAGAVAEVLASEHGDFQVGDYVTGMLGVQTHACVAGEELRQVDPNMAPLPTYLGGLGMPGVTAYFGLLDIGQPREGDTVLVSAAAGAVGTIVGQIAKIQGCRVVGTAGSAAKCAYIRDELGFDAAINYKEESLPEALDSHCPDGIDVFFDNVGGELLEAALARLALNARVVICGAISQYNNIEQMHGPRNYLSLLINRARMEGFVVFDYQSRYGEALRQLAEWRQAGRLRFDEHIETGFQRFPEVFLKLFSGENRGKLILQLDA